VPLTVQPVVVNHRGGDQRERNLELGTSWFQHQSEWAAIPADGGPADWQRIDVQVDTTRSDGLSPGASGRKVDIVQPSEPIVPKAEPTVAVSNVQLGDQDLRFSVDKVGVPILVKISYFPNWHVSGAKGPYRIAPNLMVVIPTSKDVHLTYERSNLDYFAYLLTFIGIVMLIVMRVRGDVRHANTHPFGAVSGGSDFEWDDWEVDPEPVTADPTPPESWRPDLDDSLESDPAAESRSWAPPSSDVPADTSPPDASV
jgi:hypothetical protein